MRYQAILCTALLALVGCKLPHTNNLPPSEMLMHPGPGVDGPGPGVMMLGPPPMAAMPGAASQLAFVGPEGMIVNWDVGMPGQFDSEPLICPGRYNFPQGAIYRLKLSSIPGRPGVELYPTIEIAPSAPRTEAYLAHNAIPIQFTEEDFDQVTSGNFVTKVLYLPDADYQELALAGVETLVSTRLDPGLDPIVEADRRGTILAIIRLGNKDLTIPTPEGIVGGGMGGMGGGGPMPMGPAGVPCTNMGGGAACGHAGCGTGMAGGIGGPGMPPGMVSGVTAPQYGMPITGTPIGLPGPPHIPLGIPAGLKRHSIVNHTHHHLPEPTKHMRIDVKQSPGFSYPKPANHVSIHEHTVTPPVLFRQPFSDKHELMSSAPAADCP